MDEKAVAKTPLARWVNKKMAEWEDPETGRIGLAGNALARGAGLAQSKVWSILKEDSPPKADVLIRLAEFFKVSPLVLFRLAYLQGENDTKFSPEVEAELVELESILADVPVDAQLHLISSLVSQAKMLRVAADAWKETEHAR